MQSFSSRIWTRVTVSISYGDNHYTTGTSRENLIERKKNEMHSRNKVVNVEMSFSYVRLCKF